MEKWLTTYIRPVLKWLTDTPEVLEVIRYTSAGYPCVGFRLGQAELRGIPIWEEKPLVSRGSIRDLLLKATGAPKDAALSTLLGTEIPKGNRLQLLVLHLCPKVPADKVPESNRGKPLLWMTVCEGPQLPWRFVRDMVRFLCARNRAKGKAEDEMTTAAALYGPELDAEPVAPEAEPAPALNAVALALLTASAAELDSSDDDVPTIGSKVDLNVADETADTAVSLSDAVSRGATDSVVVSSRLPSSLPVVWSKEMETAQPMYTAFENGVLQLLYADPVSLSSVAWAERLRTAFDFSVPQFVLLRQQHLLDKSDRPFIHPRKEGERGAVSFRVRSVRNAIEAALIRQAVAGNVNEALLSGAEPLVILLYGDAAGRLINGNKLWLLALIPTCFRSLSSLASVIPVAAHFGGFRDFNRKLFFGWIEDDMRATKFVNYRGREVRVKFLCVSDLADAWATFAQDDVASGRTVSFVTTATRGMTYFSLRPCPVCDATMHAICCTRRLEDTPERLMYPHVRGTGRPRLRKRKMSP